MGLKVLVAEVLTVCFVICHVDSTVAPDSLSCRENLGVQFAFLRIKIVRF